MEAAQDAHPAPTKRKALDPEQANVKSQKRGEKLRERVDRLDDKETNDPVKLAGYKAIDEAVNAGAPPAAATLVRRNLTVAQRELMNIQVDAGPHHRVRLEGTKGKKHRLVDWDAFRKVQKEQNSGSAAIEDMDSWTATLKGDLETATREAPPEAELEVIDSKLLHMWKPSAACKTGGSVNATIERCADA
ncbi:hypothetical protein HPB52_020551 [Rhipicephalus sanguineus]|uniref:Uncharacterized protein n=1 Tax=Rhipicephalus sanguineus TaxID=34632 RepID=A0A9D4PGK4_RHISA|nr:hypothetical protein HPB52_020551 [Rhipicephalus sanguineus]